MRRRGKSKGSAYNYAYILTNLINLREMIIIIDI
jgi:hypothetical protein